MFLSVSRTYCSAGVPRVSTVLVNTVVGSTVPRGSTQCRTQRRFEQLYWVNSRLKELKLSQQGSHDSALNEENYLRAPFTKIIDPRSPWPIAYLPVWFKYKIFIRDGIYSTSSLMLCGKSFEEEWWGVDRSCDVVGVYIRTVRTGYWPDPDMRCLTGLKTVLLFRTYVTYSGRKKFAYKATYSSATAWCCSSQHHAKHNVLPCYGTRKYVILRTTML